MGAQRVVKPIARGEETEVVGGDVREVRAFKFAEGHFDRRALVWTVARKVLGLVG